VKPSTTRCSRSLRDPAGARRRAAALALALALPLAAQAATADSAAEPGTESTSLSEPGPRSDFVANPSYAIPALEILGFDLAVNRLNHAFSDSRDYDVTVSSIHRNLGSSWGTDNDPYMVNQFAHPYQGSMYHGFARSAGLGYWESAGYAFAGSMAWEIAGENTLPSRNDQVASGIAGSFLGEALFRMSSLVLERGRWPAAWNELAAAAISPSTGLNRLAFGERFRAVFSSHDAAVRTALELGPSATTRNLQGDSTQSKRNAFQLAFGMEYGLPGKAGYEYSRPFDYFAFEATASTANVFDTLSTRGLLVGKPYGNGKDVHGVWGVYGSYDYISPQTWRVSSTALSIGTTAQRWLSRDIALQGTALAGAGYAAVSTLHAVSDGQYHYGVAPQLLLALRLILGDRAAIDLDGREFVVGGVGSSSTGGRDNIVRAALACTVRVYEHHAMVLKYQWNRRDASYALLSNGIQERATVGLYYSYVGDGFSGVDSR
jgi:hypothetical protein